MLALTASGKAFLEPKEFYILPLKVALAITFSLEISSSLIYNKLLILDFAAIEVMISK